MHNSHNELEQVLRKEIEGEVRFDPYSKVLYSTDASLYQMEPNRRCHSTAQRGRDQDHPDRL